MIYDSSYLFKDEFGTVWQSLIKTTVMMIGEFEYVGIFFDPAGTAQRVHFEVLTYIMFCVFLIVMSIIIMNLLVSSS